MPKKTKTVKEEVVEVPYTIPELTTSEAHMLIARDPQIKVTTLTLISGKSWATTRFPMYSGYMTKLRLAYDAGDAKGFIQILGNYFDAAYKLIPHVPGPAQYTSIMEQIQAMISLYGVRQVGKCILAQMLS